MNAFTRLHDELWISRRLREHGGGDLFEGDTNTAQRKERLRTAIQEVGLACVIVGSKQGKPVTWQQAFESLYGEPLTREKDHAPGHP